MSARTLRRVERREIPTHRFGPELEEFWSQVRSRFICFEPDQLSIEELDERSYFPLVFHSRVRIELGEVAFTRLGSFWTRLGLCLRAMLYDFDGTDGMYDVELELSIEDPEKPAARLLAERVANNAQLLEQRREMLALRRSALQTTENFVIQNQELFERCQLSLTMTVRPPGSQYTLFYDPQMLVP